MALRSYIKTTYQNTPSTSTPINQTNLNHAEDELQALDDWVDAPETDTIAEHTSGAGVTIDGVLLKDSQVSTDQINEKTSAAGVTVDGVLLKDAQVSTNVINEKTSGAGVTIDGLLIKDGTIAIGFQPGDMKMFAGTSVQSGWLLCDGQAVSRTTYAALFTAIGETWGVGNGSSTFNLPDLREAAPVGVGTYSAVTGTTHGTVTAHDAFTLGGYKDDQMQGHWHDLSNNINVMRNLSGGSVADGSARRTDTLLVGNPITDGTNGTPRTGTITRGKRIGVNFIIKY